MKHPFSVKWVVAAVIIYTAAELAIALLLAPAVLTARLASPMVRMRIEMIMHLGSYLVGGFAVGLISPGIRLAEPAVGAFVAVALVFLMSFFLPYSFIHWSTGKVLIGGTIAMVLALAGAYSGEKLMGNVEAGGASRRGQLKGRMWGDDGLLVPKRDRQHQR